MGNGVISDSAVIVMGVSGSGKSTVGAVLARMLDSPYLEGDEYHLPASIEKMSTGIALSDEDRWPWLDRLADEIDGAVLRSGVAVATCSALKRRYRDRLREKSSSKLFFVHLEAAPWILERRISSRNTHYMPVSLLQSQLESLEPPADDENAILLANNENVEETISAALAWFRGQVRQD